MRTRRPSCPAQLPLDFDAPPAPCPTTASPIPPRHSPDPLAAALERHARIAAALRSEGPNPYPDEIEEEEWSCQLAAFHFLGPLESTLLQDAEAAVEALTEMLPEQVDDYPAGLPDPTQAAFFLIYAESLAELTEAELDADLITTHAAGRADTAALIAAELSRRSGAASPPRVGPAPQRQ